MAQTILNKINDNMYYLKEREESRIQSTLIIFSPEGIVIAGDLVPCRHGCISSYGYGINWFSSDLNKDYLCSKFLQKEWSPKSALEYIKNFLEEYPEMSEECKEYIKLMEEDDVHHDTMFRDEIEYLNDYYDFKENGDYIEYCDMTDYDERDADLLFEIQNNFKMLYEKMNEA